MKPLPLEAHEFRLRDGTLMTYHVAGRQEGRPIVLLHGGGTDHALLSWEARSPRLLKRTLAAIVRHPDSLTDDLVQQVAQASMNRNSQRAWNQFQRHEIRWAGLTSNFTPRLRDLRVPTLLIHGSHDVGVPVQAVREAARLIPDASLYVVEGAGHWTQRDCPGEVNDILLRFLGEA